MNAPELSHLLNPGAKLQWFSSIVNTNKSQLFFS